MTIKSKMRLRLVGRRVYTVTRKEPSGYVDGTWQDGLESTFEVKGHEQPSSPLHLQMLPDSFRTKDVRLFMATSDLNTLEEGEGQEADKVSIEGKNFVPHKKSSYQMGPVQHYEYIVVREEQSAGGVG